MTTLRPDHRPLPVVHLRRLRDDLFTAMAHVSVPHWVHRLAPWVFGSALLAHLVTVVLWPSAHWSLVDVGVYQAGGDAVLTGTPLYAPGFGGLPFTYPPFAAVLFGPLALLPGEAVKVLSTLGNLALLAYVVRRCAHGLGITGQADLTAVTWLFTGVLFWTEPVRTTFYLGQINLLLLAVVVADLARPTSRWQGMGIGLVAAIKLTPLFFLPYLLLTRRFRAAAVAGATFLATIVAGFVLAPADSTTYWLDGIFLVSGRVGDVAHTNNHSLHGTAARLLGVTTGAEVAWVLASVVIGGAALLAAASAHHRGDLLLSLAIAGMGAAAVSPFSWPHHWVYFVPLTLVLVHRRAWTGLAGLAVATVAYVTDLPDRRSDTIPGTGLISVDLPAPLSFVCHNAYLVILVVTITTRSNWWLRTAGGKVARRYDGIK